MNKSVYDIVLENINADGCISESFSIDDGDEGNIRFAPGALDGVMIFHAGIKTEEKIADKLTEQIIKLCGRKAVSNVCKRSIEKKIEDFVNKSHCLSVVDRVQEKLCQNGEAIDGEKLFDYGYQLAFKSSHIECVKLGIAILGMFDTKDAKLCKMLSDLGAYEELTLYVAVAFSNWENGNSMLFELAKRVNGWGKIHIVERLEPVDDEIRTWIFKHGCENCIMDAYLGLLCARNGDYIGVLRKESLKKDELDAACRLFCALTDEGPVEGISVYEYADEAANLLVRHLEKQAETVLHFSLVTELKAWIEENDCVQKDVLIEICDSILERESVKKEIRRCITEGSESDVNRAVNLGDKLGMDNSEIIYEAVKKSPMELSWHINSIKNKSEYVKELVKLYEKLLPLDEMATGATKAIFPKEYVKEFNVMDFVLYVLDGYPGVGEKIVLSAMASPATRGRNSACRVIEAWVEKGKLSENIISKLRAAVKSEVDKDLKNRLKKIIKMI